MKATRWPPSRRAIRRWQRKKPHWTLIEVDLRDPCRTSPTSKPRSSRGFAPLLHEDNFTAWRRSEAGEAVQYRQAVVRIRPWRSRGRLRRKPISSSSNEFKTEAAHQGYIEPHACLATYSEDGSSELWCCTQGHFHGARHLCRPARHIGLAPAGHRVGNRRWISAARRRSIWSPSRSPCRANPAGQ